MAHVQTQYAKLYKPGAISENVDPQKMFIDNISQEEANYLSMLRMIVGSVSSITELRSVSTSDTNRFVSGMIVVVRSNGLFQFDASSTDSDDGIKIIAPATGTGRWIAIDKNYIDHVASNTLHITSAERTAWNAKVDSAVGMGLSSNDYTTGEKNKLANISADADKVEASGNNGNIKINGSETNVYTHPSGTNPHNTTKADVGLDKVPNVATNDQTPTYTMASSLLALVSGEFLSTAFGKISKAIGSLITHLQDGVSHITSGERTAWNSASSSSHTHGNKSTLDGITAAYTTDEKNKLSGIEANANKYSHPTSHPWSMITGAPSSYPANGGNADTVDGLHIIVSTTVPTSLSNNTICIVYE